MSDKRDKNCLNKIPLNFTFLFKQTFLVMLRNRPVMLSEDRDDTRVSFVLHRYFTVAFSFRFVA